MRAGIIINTIICCHTVWKYFPKKITPQNFLFKSTLADPQPLYLSSSSLTLQLKAILLFEQNTIRWPVGNHPKPNHVNKLEQNKKNLRTGCPREQIIQKQNKPRASCLKVWQVLVGINKIIHNLIFRTLREKKKDKIPHERENAPLVKQNTFWRETWKMSTALKISITNRHATPEKRTCHHKQSSLRVAKIMLMKKNEVGGITLPNIKVHYIAPVIIHKICLTFDKATQKYWMARG